MHAHNNDTEIISNKSSGYNEETERQNAVMVTDSGTSSHTNFGASTATHELRRSKRCITNPCPWTSLMSKSKKHGHKSFEQKTKEFREGSCGIGIGVMNVNSDLNVSMRKIRKSNNGNTSLEKRTILSSSVKRKRLLRNKQTEKNKNRKLSPDVTVRGDYDDFWNLLYSAFAESSSDEESLCRKILKAHQVEQLSEPSSQTNSFGLSSVDKPNKDDKLHKCDCNKLETGLENIHSDESCSKSSDGESCPQETFKVVSVASEPVGSCEILNLHLSDVPNSNTSDSLLDSLEVTNKYIVAVCETSGEENNEFIFKDKRPSSMLSNRSSVSNHCNGILRSGLGEFILCAASDPQRRRKQNSTPL
ncbi:hypothetical protein ElyMa_000724100 [Elysia marginata]|uniref:Uncharacterized protein n=1 Tax=Elysia marginata TaxID=1093978 RepID=A0AAV4GLJ5_9GAST|nr:hypothetical protein ElyMa_000724100 [Elysia marginata]